MAITREDFPLPDVDDPVVGEYFTAAARGELCVPRCIGCSRWCWYPKPACPQCGSNLEWTTTSGRGALFSWAVVERAFLPAFAEMVPFVTALVALEEDPVVRLVTVVVDADPNTLVADQLVVATFRPLRFPTVPGREVVVPMFTPAGVSP